MDSDDDGDQLQSQALPVDEKWSEEELEDLIKAGPPSTAEEYLARVRYESSKLPSIVTAEVVPGTKPLKVCW